MCSLSLKLYLFGARQSQVCAPQQLESHLCVSSTQKFMKTLECGAGESYNVSIYSLDEFRLERLCLRSTWSE